MRVILEAVTHSAALILESDDKKHHYNDNKDLKLSTKSDRIRNINHNEFDEDRKEFKSILQQTVSVCTELTSVTFGTSTSTSIPTPTSSLNQNCYSNTNTSGISGPSSTMELNLNNSGIDDETLFNIIDLLEGNSFPLLHNSKNIPEKDKNSNYVPESSPSSLLARSHIGGSGDYFSRVLLLSLRGNSLTDVSCKVSGIDREEEGREREQWKGERERGRRIRERDCNKKEGREEKKREEDRKMEVGWYWERELKRMLE